jgi:hypothetical protein
VRGFVVSFAELGNRRFSVVERGRECSQDENARNKQNELFPKTTMSPTIKRGDAWFWLQGVS